jgi:hypothetical protein
MNQPKLECDLVQVLAAVAGALGVERARTLARPDERPSAVPPERLGPASFEHLNQ